MPNVISALIRERKRQESKRKDVMTEAEVSERDTEREIFEDAILLGLKI